MPPSCALLGGFAIGARVALLWQHNANPSSKLASIPRYDDIVRTAGWAGSTRVASRRRSSPAPAGDARSRTLVACRRPERDGGRPKNRAPHTASGRGRPVGNRPPTGGVLNITAAVWNAGFPLVAFWQQKANAKC